MPSCFFCYSPIITGGKPRRRPAAAFDCQSITTISKATNGINPAEREETVQVMDVTELLWKRLN